MLTLSQAHEHIRHHLGDSARARHSLFIGHGMRILGRQLDANRALWEIVGLCHDLDYFATASDATQHGLVTADWLAEDLPAEALDAIKAHDHRTGVISDTPLADALRLVDAVAIADMMLGRKRLVDTMRSPNGAGALKRALPDRPYLPDMIVTLAGQLDVSLGALADICADAPQQ